MGSGNDIEFAIVNVSQLLLLGCLDSQCHVATCSGAYDILAAHPLPPAQLH
jgi:hypothetical protein